MRGHIKVIGIAVAAVLVVAVIPSCAGIRGKTCVAPALSSGHGAESSYDFNRPGGIGQEVRDGKFAFVVSGIDQACVGDPVKVHMKVTNTGTDPEEFSAGEQLLLRNPYHPTGQMPENGWACTSCHGDGQRLYINPKDSVDTVVSFDVKGEEPAINAVELHDSMFSLGVKVYP